MNSRFFSTSRPILNAVAARIRKPKLPIISTNITPLTAKEAVDNILYNAPQPDYTPAERHTLNCLVSNEPGVLSRVSGILAGRGINIDSLVVARTELQDLSRMTIVITGQDEKVEQARRQLEDIVPVWAVLDYSRLKTVDREMLLIKVATVPHEYEGDEGITTDVDVHNTGHQVPSLISSALQRQSITELARLFNARVVDVSLESVIIELSAKPDRIDAFVELLKPFGILEAARSGTMAMPRAVMEGLSQKEITEAAESVDLSSLPPG